MNLEEVVIFSSQEIKLDKRNSYIRLELLNFLLISVLPLLTRMKPIPDVAVMHFDIEFLGIKFPFSLNFAFYISL